MRLTSQVIRSRAQRPLQSVEYLDLSDLDIVKPDKLGCCPKLQKLNLSGNTIDRVSHLESCPQLWSIDLSNNKITNLEGLNRFVALGNLVLSNNDISWQELAKIRHIHILNLSLHGNQQLEKDPYYRIHVVDSLPNVWMLDGRFITSAERLQVEHFFRESSFTDHPVRHKLKDKGFTPSKLKKIEVTGVFGDKATHLMTRFPINGALNIETDRRRMKYLAYNVQEDLKLIDKSLNLNLKLMKHSPQFLERVMEDRNEEREKCNMLLLLLVASLEFALPAHLVKATLDIARMDKVSNTSTIELFLLPKRSRCMVVCLLLGAVKLDRDEDIEGGLYGRLYLCLYYTISELSKLCYADKQTRENYQPSSSVYKDYRCLLASEIVQLLCIVPTFFQYLTKDVGVINLLCTATDDYDIAEKITSLMESIRAEGGSTKVLYETTADFVLKKVQDQATNLFHKTSRKPHPSKGDDTLENQRALPRRPHSSPVHRAEYHTTGRKSPDKRPTRVISGKPPKLKTPCLGERVLLGPQNEARIISLPEPGIGLAQMDIVPVQGMYPLGKNSDNFLYLDLTSIEWDSACRYWRPKGSVGDRITFDDSKMTSKGRPMPSALTPRDTVDMLVGETAVVKDSGDQKRVKFTKEGNEVPSRPMSSMLCEKLDIKLDVDRGAIINTVLTIAEGEREKEMRTQNRIEAFDHPAISHERKRSAKTNKAKVDIIEVPQSMEPIRSPLYESINEAVRTFSGQPLGQVSVNELKITPSSGIVAPIATRTAKALIDVPSSKSDKNNVVDNDSLCSDEDPELGDLHSDISGPVTGAATFHSGTRPNTAHTKHIPRETIPEVPAPGSPVTLRERMSPVTIRLPNQRGDHEAEVLEYIERQPPPNSPKMGYEIQYPPYRRTSSRERRIQGSPRSGFMVKKPRPFSAVGAYKFIVDQGSNRTTPREGDITSYQKQRTEAWKRSSVEQNTNGDTATMAADQGPPDTPPPQRPSSPEFNDHPAILQFRNGNRWLGGGRNLHMEEVDSRPKSGHIPGWKEGLEFTGPNRAYRRTRPPELMTPSSMYFEEFAAAGIDRRSFQRMLNINAPDLEVPNNNYQQPSQFGIRSWYLTSNSNSRPDKPSNRRPYTPQRVPDVLCHICSARAGDCLHDYEYQLELIRAQHKQALNNGVSYG